MLKRNLQKMKNESEIIRLLMLLSDTQIWLNKLNTDLINQMHPMGIKLMKGKDYRLSITALSHIIERHYYKTMRYPGSSKFTICLSRILDLLKDAGLVEPKNITGSENLKRSIELNEPVGCTKIGEEAYRFIVVTDYSGNIITAYPE